LNREVWQKVDSLVYFFLFPVLLFHSIVKSPLDLNAASNLIAAGVSMGLIAIVLSYSLPYLPVLGRYIDRKDHAGAVQVGFRFNSYMALALSERLAGPEGLLLMSVLIGMCVPIFNMAAIWPMARHSQTNFGRELVRNPFIIATVSGLLANLIGFHIPSWLEPSVSRIGAGSLALGLMAAGAGMRLGSIAQAKSLSVAVLLIKHMVLPLVALFLSHALDLSKAQTLVLLAFSALPTAPTAYVLAARMGYNGPLVAGLVTLSTLMGLLSLPFAIALSTLRPWT
jgi:predicted permease